MVFAKYLAPRAILQYPWRWRNIDQKKAFRRSVIVLEKVKPLQQQNLCFNNFQLDIAQLLGGPSSWLESKV